MKNEPKKPILDNYFSGNELVRHGHMFGYPAYYVERTMFACLYEGKVGLKVPEDVANEARNSTEISDFRPKGKAKMREWIQFDFDTEKDLNSHKKLIDSAFEYAVLRTSKSV